LDGLGEHRKFVEKINLRRAEIANRSILTSSIPSDECVDLPSSPSQDFNILDKKLSAKAGISRSQLIFLVVTGFTLVFGLFAFPKLSILIISAVFSLFYLSVVLFRAWILADFGRQTNMGITFPKKSPDEKYVILCAVYKEQNMIGDLVLSLDHLRWAKSRKSVYFLCEEKDTETIGAIKKQVLPENFYLVIVPDGDLRTKPRALNYALRQVQGDYLVIYDAEDRPHPDQLLEAAAAFNQAPDEVVCLQAPLVIDNSRESFFTRLFAIEYSTLFHGILPAIANMKAPMPLGGTSNHFKLDALKEAGGWDSYNVTEDADLGIRLARKGKLCGVIQLPTYEEAPVELIAWIKQRTRWLKGWMQTLQVHFREPSQLIADMGFVNFLKFNLIMTSVVVSVLIHPFFLGAFTFQMVTYFSSSTFGFYDISITGLSAFNLVAGYTTYGVLAFAVLTYENKNNLRKYIILLPFYWVLISIAGWRAVLQMILSPHRWEKTSHGSKNRPPIAKNL
jgi:cellulose synthase/poly-beta-1,6-N-acetylglucosamine synthase-like glycosyltransferase